MSLRVPLGRDTLGEILGTPHLNRWPDRAISSICNDHRKMPADLFVAVQGQRHDATDYIRDAIKDGARGIVCQSPPFSDVDASVSWWQVEDARLALGQLAHAGAGWPGRKMRVFGITGTNGKSTTVGYLSSILQETGGKVGWMTTLEHRVGDRTTRSSMTTEDPMVIADSLARHLESGGTDMVLEVSSHAIDQQRIGGLSLTAAAITSLGRDHLDYHGTIEQYHETKQRLGDWCPDGAAFVRPHPQQDSSAPAGEIRFQVEGFADAVANIIDGGFEGSSARFQTDGFTGEVKLRQMGRHNVSNALVASAIAAANQISATHIVAGIDKATAVAGRLQSIESPVGRIYIDFAHTPDAIDAVISTLRPLVSGRLILLFGCGGERDQGKRQQMGSSASRADHLIVTSDNPRGEDPQQIIDQVLTGVSAGVDHNAEVDRRLAIETAVKMLKPDDVLVIAGKGHEDTQQIGDRFHSFDDHRVTCELLEQHYPFSREVIG
jgi:UDP-N-acetylmuramoyl-L-alanyl-D-glutamate--2,6-diaminopimelate ligase